MHDKNYRKIWRSYQTLRSIASGTKRDIESIDKVTASILALSVAVFLVKMGSCIAQMPFSIDWDDMSVASLFAIPIIGRLPDGTQWKIATYVESGEGFVVRSNGAEHHVVVDKGMVFWNGGNASCFDDAFGINQSTVMAIISECLCHCDASGASSSIRTGKKVVESKSPDDTAVVDLCSVRAHCITTSEVSESLLPAIFVEQVWRADKNGGNSKDYTLHCEDAAAIFSSYDGISIKTLTMKDAFTNPRGDVLKAILHFVDVLKGVLPFDSLCYIVPDWVDNFAIASVSSAVNSKYQKASPLPKSIAAVARWSETSDFDNDNLGEGDVILAADEVDVGGEKKVYITPIMASSSNELNAVMSETRGIYWERFPSFCASKCQSDTEIDKDITRRLLIVDNGEWVKQDAVPPSESTILLDQIEKTLRDMRIDAEKNVYVLPLSSSIAVRGSAKRNWLILPSCKQIVSGAALLCKREAAIRREKDAAGIPLWRDHLPSLSVEVIADGRFSVFWLVKNRTMLPMQGKEVDIPVEEHFTLPAGAAEYKFPLQQGDGRDAISWAAEISHPSFPLANDVVCDMKMTYTYGSDKPYKLRLVPSAESKNYAPFKQLIVEWKNSGNDRGALDVSAPPFTVKKSWADLRHWQNKTGNGDLIAECILLFDLLAKVHAPEFLLPKRVNGIVKEIRQGESGRYWIVSSNIGSILCHSKNLIERVSPMEIGEGCALYFTPIQDKYKRGKWIARDITVSSPIPIEYEQRIKSSHSRDMEDYYNGVWRTLHSCSYHIVNIWGDGRSLQDRDAPNELRVATMKAQEKMREIYDASDAPGNVRNEINKLCASMHKDCPEQIIGNLHDPIYIGRAIGNCKLDWQKERFADALKRIRGGGKRMMSAIKILAIALWRNKDLVYLISTDDASCIVGTIHSELSGILNSLHTFESNKDVAQYPNGITVKEIRQLDDKVLSSLLLSLLSLLSYLANCVELYLAILRLRSVEESSGMQQLLAPATDEALKCVKTLDDICETLSSPALHGFKIRSFIDVGVQKGENLGNVPDLIFALRQFLTGDKGAAHISVSINEEEQ